MKLLRIIMDEFYIRKLCKTRGIKRKKIFNARKSCAKLRVLLYLLTGELVNQYEIEAPLPTSNRNLLIALHELGHCYLKHSERNPTTIPFFDHEVEAWQWAINHFPHTLTDDDSSVITEFLGSYIDNRILHTNDKLNIGGKEWAH